MQIELNNAGKRYNRDWIFRGVNHVFDAKRPTVVLGSNGSGKSTLLQVISTRLTLSEGEVTYRNQTGQVVTAERCFKDVAIATPYMELIEEFTLAELVGFYLEHQLFQQQIDAKSAIRIMELEKAEGKPLRYFSSGMKQRVKLALAILSDTPVLLLDEPVSNLDHKGMDWYRQLISDYAGGRVVVVCSNHQTVEYDFCIDQLVVEDYKPSLGQR